jgi:hypothetical protein
VINYVWIYRRCSEDAAGAGADRAAVHDKVPEDRPDFMHRHYTVSELAKAWHFDEPTVRGAWARRSATPSGRAG